MNPDPVVIGGDSVRARRTRRRTAAKFIIGAAVRWHGLALAGGIAPLAAMTAPHRRDGSAVLRASCCPTSTDASSRLRSGAARCWSSISGRPGARPAGRRCPSSSRRSSAIGDKGVQFVGIAVDQADKVARIREGDRLELSGADRRLRRDRAVEDARQRALALPFTSSSIASGQRRPYAARAAQAGAARRSARSAPGERRLIAMLAHCRDSSSDRRAVGYCRRIFSPISLDNLRVFCVKLRAFIARSTPEGCRMDLRKLKTLIDLVETSGIAELEIQEGEERVRITRAPFRSGQQSVTLPHGRRSRRAAAAPAAARRPPKPRRPPRPKAMWSRARWSARSIARRRRAPSRSSRSATRSRQGDTLCIVEAMKLMNEIEADDGGHDQGDPRRERPAVEYGQPLFVIELKRPSAHGGRRVPTSCSTRS